jgi:hypothetical protein
MRSKKFKEIVDSALKEESFLKGGNHYYRYSDEIIYVIGLQKSNYSNSYYINIGYFICHLDISVKKPKTTDGHIRTRMVFKDKSEKEVDYIDLDIFTDIEASSIVETIKSNISNLIKKYEGVSGIKKMLKEHQIMLYQTTIKAKSFLGLE